MGSWRDFWESFKEALTPPAVRIREAEDTLEKALLENESLRKDRARLAKAVQRLEGREETLTGQLEAERQKNALLRAQAGRCKCRS